MPTPTRQNAANEPQLTLEPAPPNSESREETNFLTHPGFYTENQGESLWDAVAKRNVITERQTSFDQIVAENTDFKSNDWLLINRSSGGLGLLWTGKISPQITVGELVASRKQVINDETQTWITGVVTWMRVDDDQHLRCGITQLAQDVRPVLVERTRGSHNSITTHTECLLASTLDRSPLPCIIVPAYMFHTGETINIREDKNIVHYKLLDKLDSTGSFSLFRLETCGSSLTRDGLEKQNLKEFGLYDDSAQS